MAGPRSAPSVRADPIDTAREASDEHHPLLLNAGLQAFVLWANLGARTVSRPRVTLPLLLVAVAAGMFLRDVPTAGNDLHLELAGVTAGAVLGLVAATLIRVDRDATGRLVMRAGAAPPSS